MNSPDGPTTRRAYLASVGAVGVASLAGCTGGGGGAETVPVKGNPDAAVTLEVYEDFACPACAGYNQRILPDIETEYIENGRIRYEHRDFPFVADPQSWQAASASRAVHDAAGDEAFWTYAAGLFEQQSRLRTDASTLFADLADEQGLDADEIQTAALQQEYEDAAQSDMQRGQNFGISGTPGFVINDSLANLGEPTTLQELADALTSEIDRALADADGGGS